MRSYRTISPLPVLTDFGGIISVALSIGLRRPGVTWHPALRSPDFPLYDERTAIVWPTPALIIPSEDQLVPATFREISLL